MAEKRGRRPRNEEQLDLMDDDDLRGSSDKGGEEFEIDEDGESEGDGLDEDIIDENAVDEDRPFARIDSE